MWRNQQFKRSFFAHIVHFSTMIMLLSWIPGNALGDPAKDREAQSQSNLFDQLRRTWKLIEERYWQIESASFEDPSVTESIEQTQGQCPLGMVEIEGRMRLDPNPMLYAFWQVERMQLATCTDWISKKWPYRCKSFDRERWTKTIRDLKTRYLHFCIDRFEYPNQKGQYPFIYVSWNDADRLCQEQGKRLCTEDEWTFACEGVEAMPYPYGYERDPEKCAIDREPRRVNPGRMLPRNGTTVLEEIDRLWQGHAAGAMPGCRSQFGVYDMTGNVDEWTRSVHKGERPSILKGGYWGPGNNRCRPSTRVHYEEFAFYQQGFRCCAAVPSHREFETR